MEVSVNNQRKPSATHNLPSAANPAPISNILVKTGIISQSLVDIFPVAPGAKPRPVRLGRKATVKARVLTSQEIVNELHEYETKKKNEIAANGKGRCCNQRENGKESQAYQGGTPTHMSKCKSHPKNSAALSLAGRKTC